VDRSFKFWNKKLLEFTRYETLRGLHLEDVFRDPNILSTFKEAFSSEENKRQSFPFWYKGSSKVFSLSVVPLKKQSDGKVYGALGIFNDITQIEKTEVMRMDFVANVSHELRTPLTSVKGYAQAIEQEVGEADGTLKKYAQVISKSVDRLINIVNDLLELSYLESGVRLDIGEVNPREVSEQVLEQLESARSQKNQILNLNVKVDRVRADRNRLEQVLINLVQNAIKYSPENSVVEVAWEKTENQVLLKVRDNGPGIDQEHLPRLFERFYRVDKARSAGQGGTGLGLAIVKHIMQRHGGTVSVVSDNGKGTEFICRFPG
jgi:two-component system, OmpR family, phosphate regulon sensor histidine kinase PhoR